MILGGVKYVVTGGVVLHDAVVGSGTIRIGNRVVASAGSPTELRLWMAANGIQESEVFDWDGCVETGYRDVLDEAWSDTGPAEGFA